MSVREDWVLSKATDDQMLQETSKLKGSCKDRNLLIITGHYAVQHCDYLRIVNMPNIDTMTMNFGYLLPGSENFTWIFYGSMGYIKSFNACVTYKYFNRSFKGKHVFMGHTKHCVGGLYPIASKQSVITTIKNNNLKNYYLITHAYAKKGLGYVPDSLNHYSPAHIPYGCGGTLNAMALPFVLQLGYKNIYILGVGSQYSTHFYDKEWVQGQQLSLKSPHIKLILDRYRRLNSLATKNGSRIIVFPKSCTEQSIQNIFPCVEKI